MGFLPTQTRITLWVYALKAMRARYSYKFPNRNTSASLRVPWMFSAMTSPIFRDTHRSSWWKYIHCHSMVIGVTIISINIIFIVISLTFDSFIGIQASAIHHRQHHHHHHHRHLQKQLLISLIFHRPWNQFNVWGRCRYNFYFDNRFQVTLQDRPSRELIRIYRYRLRRFRN